MNALKVKMTVHQRLSLEGLIRNQRCKVVSDAELFFGAGKKFALPDSEKKLYLKEVNGGVAVNLEKIRLGPVEEFDFEAGEIRKFIERMDSWASEDGIPPDDVEWFSPLRAALAEAKNAVDKA